MILWRILGLIALALGIVGAVLPVLPTTPFVLLASWCFAKSSPALHNWLKNSKYFGGLIRNWESQRCISKKTRLSALASIALFGGSSLYFFVPSGYPTWITASLLAIGIFSVMRIPVCPALDANKL